MIVYRRKTVYRIVSYSWVVAVAAWGASCGDSEPTPTVPETPNRPPITVGTIPTQTVVAGQVVTVNLASYFSDPDGDALSYQTVSSNTAVATASVSGAAVNITGVSAGAVVITVTASDPAGSAAQQQISVTVERANQAPVAVGTVPAQTMTAGETVTVDVAPFFNDPDGDALTYVAVTSNAAVASVSVSGSTLTIVAVAEGSATVTVTARDPGGLEATQSAGVTVERANQAPVAVGTVPAQTMTAGETATVDVAPFFSDPDGDALTYEAISSNDGVATAAISGDIVTVTAVAEGSATIQITARDPGGLSARQSFGVTVEDDGGGDFETLSGFRVRSDGGITLRVGAIIQSVGQSGCINGGTYNGKKWEYHETWWQRDSGSGWRDVPGTDKTGRLCGYDLSSASSGKYRGVGDITAADVRGKYKSENEVSVGGGSNQAPVATGSVPAQSLTPGQSTQVDLAPFFNDPDGDALTYTASSSNAGIATVSVSGGTLTATAVAAGTATVTVTATDPGELSASQTIRVTVTEGGGTSGDRAALVALYNATDGPNWVSNENWLTDAPLGEWYGVDTDASGRVVALHLGGTYRNGEYVAPGLSGVIPPELGALTRLVTLDLDANDLSGAIPPELGELANLTTLDLRWNDLTEIPPELGDLASLKVLRFYGNNLSGDIPPELGNLTSLTYLGLGENRLTGRIPPALGRLANLETLRLYLNRLTGPIPPALGNLASLEVLWLSGNNLSGPIPSALGSLAHLRWLGLRRNDFSGPIPVELGNLASLTNLSLARNNLSGLIPESFFQLARLEIFGFEENDGLCAPGTTDFVTWLEGIEADGPYCNEADAAALEQLYNVSGGPNWTNSDGWLGPPVLADWHGVSADSLGRVTELDLTGNGLAGSLSAALGILARMTTLRIGSNALTGRLPSSLTQLPLHEFHYADTELCAPPLSSFREWLNSIASHRGTGVECAPLSEREILEVLYDATGGPNWSRSDNWLTAAPLGDWYGVRADASGRIVQLTLARNNLAGIIPPELGSLASLTELDLWRNRLEGQIPSELGSLANLEGLFLGQNDLAGAIPSELGRIANLEDLYLNKNGLTGQIPPELGSPSIEYLFLDNNDLAGPLPPAFGRMSSLKRLGLTNNARMEGPLPHELTALVRLEAILAGGTQLCAPPDPGFQAWLARVHSRRVMPCNPVPTAAYVTQAVQSRGHPVPLVAGEKALLRVFPTARIATSQGIPAVRARFYLNGRETHVEDIRGNATPIPTAVDESSLATSANAEIPAEVIQPGLEMVVEVDPDSTLDPELGVVKRIPATGRVAIDVQAMPVLDLTVIPFIWEQTQDSSVVDLIEAMAVDPENHELLEETRTLLPVGDLEVTAHEPVLLSVGNLFAVLSMTKAIRAMEGGTGHYAGIMSYPGGGGPAGVANIGGRAISAIPDGSTIAHELGHNMNLAHAPCGAAGDPSFPYLDGSIGAWGYDFGDGGRLVPPSTGDLMSYCDPVWISDYSFTNALRYRLFDEGSAAGATVAASTRSLLLWGGMSADSVPFLEPTFVVDAPALLPDSAGGHRITGRTAAGTELFSLSFTMPETADGDGSSGFVFVLPVQSRWEGGLASITLTGPGGTVTLDEESDIPMAILRNPRNGQVRGILRDPPLPTQVAADVAGTAAGLGLEVLFSRGIPDAAVGRRR